MSNIGNKETPRQKKYKIRRSSSTKETEEERRSRIEIPKHLFTVMAQTLREKQIDKSHVKPQKLEWAGTATERKRTSVIYHHIPENLKNLCGKILN